MINLVKIGLFGLYLNWYPINIYTGTLIPYATYGFLMLVVIGILGDAMSGNSSVGLQTREINCWILYFAISLFTSIIAVNMNYAIKSLPDYAVRLVIVIAIVYICRREESIYFSVKLLAVVSLLSAIMAFLQKKSISGRLSLTSGATLSVNDFGALMAFGCFAVILYFGYSKIKSETFRMGGIAASSMILIVELFISGSRKSFYAIAVLFSLLVIMCNGKIKRLDGRKIIAFLLVFLVGVFIANKYLMPNVESTSLYERLWGRKVEALTESNESRVNFYRLALKDFLSNPIFGLGFNNFYYVHGNYTHSTFADPLACSGIFSILYFMPYVSIFRRLLYNARYEKWRNNGEYISRELLAFYIMFLVIGLGIPYIYKDIPCIILGMLIAWNNIPRDYILEGEYDE